MIIKKKFQELLTYLEDTSNIDGRAEILFLPINKDEVLDAVVQCRKNKTPITISAGKTGTTGGCVSQKGAIISLEKLNKILELDVKRQKVKVEAGVTLEDLNSRIKKNGLMLRASPTESLAYVGGIVSTNASGVRGFGYGSIRRYVEEIEIVLTTGEVINIKRGEFFSNSGIFDFEYKSKNYKFTLPQYNMPKVKTQAGYFIKPDMDLIDLFIGSEGTLGIILTVIFSLQKIPYGVFDGLLFFLKERDALIFADKIKALQRENKICAASLEFLDKNTLLMLKDDYSFVSGYEAAIYFEQEAETENDYDDLIDKWRLMMEQSKADMNSSIFADTLKERERIFEFRHRVPQMINEFLRQNDQTKIATDISVPWDKFSKMYEYYKKCGEKSKIPYVNFGHIGESHLHFNFLPQNLAQSKKAKEYVYAFCEMAVALGGSVSAEHGIGKIKKSYLKVMYTQAEIKQMVDLKKYFDPYCLIGLDNIFEKEILFKSK